MTVNVKKILPLASLVFLLSACDDSVLGGGSSSSVPEDPKQMYELGKDYFSGMNVEFDREKAVELFTMAADADYPQAEYMLACLYIDGNSVPKDYQKATKYFRKAADHGISEAAIRLSETLHKKNGLIVSKEEAVEYLKQAAESDPRSMTFLAKLYMYGDGVENNYKKAEALLLKASSYKEPEALLILSDMYFSGAPGILRDDYKGMNFLKIAMNDPDNSDKSRIHMALGKVYLYGRGVPVDEKLAVEYFAKAGEQGLLDAQIYLGDRYWYEKDYKRAQYWYGKAAQQNHVQAQLRLAEISQQGLCGEVNLQEAIAWNEKAVLNGSEQARFNLVLLYAETDSNPEKLNSLIAGLEEQAESGDRGALSKLFYLYAGDSKLHDGQKAKGYLQQIIDYRDMMLIGNIGENLLHGGNHIQQNPEYAMVLLNYAADHGDHSVRIKLGDLYRKGEFVAADPIKAYAWYNLGIDKGNKADVDSRIKSLKLNRRDLKKANAYLEKLRRSLSLVTDDKIDVMSAFEDFPLAVAAEDTEVPAAEQGGDAASQK